MKTKKRKLEGKTDYRQREKLLKAGERRVVIRKSDKYIRAQVIEYKPKGDETLVDTKSLKLKEYGWEGGFNNIPASYLTGFLTGKKAKQKGIEKCVPDLGMKKPSGGSKIYACLKGFIDASIKVPHSKEVFPSEERIKGQHIAEYGKKLKENNPEKLKEVFKRTDPLKIPKLFEKVKSKIEGE